MLPPTPSTSRSPGTHHPPVAEGGTSGTPQFQKWIQKCFQKCQKPLAIPAPELPDFLQKSGAKACLWPEVCMAKGAAPTPSIRCGYTKCKKFHVDCKNSCYVLSIKDVDPEQCRNFRKHTQTLRFCSKSHLSSCKLVKASTRKRSSRARRGAEGREPLTPEQVGVLFRTLVQQVGSAWAGVLCLLQLFLGDRADAARQASTEWFQNLNPNSGNPPSVEIPDINGKTTARTIFLAQGFAAMLWAWITDPLKCGKGKTSWPHEGQNLYDAFLNLKPALLFPGRVSGGCNLRAWNKAITEKAYHNAIRAAAHFIETERAEAHKAKQSHPYDNFNLNRLGTHSMKKTCVTELCEQNVSLAIISQLTGTTQEVLMRHYYKPSESKKQEAVSHGFANVVAVLQDASVKYCSQCGLQQKLDWNFCPTCGTKCTA